MSIILGETRNRGKGQAGFSLIEAMVAILIFAIGILGAYKLQIHATLGNTLANRVSTSAMWATYAVEQIVGKQYGHSDLCDDEGVVDPDCDGDGVDGLNDIGTDADGVVYVLKNGNVSTDPSGALYSVFWNVAEGTGPGGEPTLLRGVKQIRVRVYRNGGIGSGNLYNHDYYRVDWPKLK